MAESDEPERVYEVTPANVYIDLVLRNKWFPSTTRPKVEPGYKIVLKAPDGEELLVGEVLEVEAPGNGHGYRDFTNWYKVHFRPWPYLT